MRYFQLLLKVGNHAALLAPAVKQTLDQRERVGVKCHTNEVRDISCCFSASLSCPAKSVLAHYIDTMQHWGKVPLIYGCFCIRDLIRHKPLWIINIKLATIVWRNKSRRPQPGVSPPLSPGITPFVYEPCLGWVLQRHLSLTSSKGCETGLSYPWRLTIWRWPEFSPQFLVIVIGPSGVQFRE